MKIVKHYWFIAIALITMISFSSCENDEERGFDISGLYGKTWWGEMGFEDPYGERLYSYITFTSGVCEPDGRISGWNCNCSVCLCSGIRRAYGRISGDGGIEKQDVWN